MTCDSTSTGMKKAILDEQTNIGGVVFRLPFVNASPEQKDIWKWIVMEVLPSISLAWKIRVNQGAALGNYKGGELLDIVTSSDLAFCYMTLDWGAKKWAKSIGNNGQERSSEESVVAEESVASRRRGRKKGQEGPASVDNINKFNNYAWVLDEWLYRTGNPSFIGSWQAAAMAWVTRETLDEETSDEDSVIYEESKPKKVVPFVASRRATVITQV